MRYGIKFKLTNDIDMSKGTNGQGTIQRFTGTMDGDNHIIKNVSYEKLNSHNFSTLYLRSAGLFWDIYQSVNIKNLTVEFINTDSWYYHNTMGLVQSTLSDDKKGGCKLNIDNVTLKGSMYCYENEYAPFISKVYHTKDEISISNSTNEVNVYNSFSKSSAFIGSLSKKPIKVSVTNCVNKGDIVSYDLTNGQPSLVIASGGNNLPTDLTISNITNEGKVISFKSSDNVYPLIDSTNNNLNDLTFNNKYIDLSSLTSSDSIYKELDFDSSTTYQDQFNNVDNSKFIYVISSHFDSYNSKTSVTTGSNIVYDFVSTISNQNKLNLTKINVSTYDDVSSLTLINEYDTKTSYELKRYLYQNSSNYEYYLCVANSGDTKLVAHNNAIVTMMMYQLNSNNELIASKLFVMPDSSKNETKLKMYDIKVSE